MRALNCSLLAVPGPRIKHLGGLFEMGNSIGICHTRKPAGLVKLNTPYHRLNNIFHKSPVRLASGLATP